MKELWGKISYWWFITIILIIGLFTGDIKVKGATIENWSVKQVKIQTCNGDGVCSWSSNYDANHNFTGSDMSYPVQALEWRVKASDGLSIDNSYNFQFGYKPTPDAIMYDEVFMRRSASASKEEITCTKSIDSNSYYMWNCTFTPLENYSSSQYLYIQVHFYQGYLTSMNTKITGFDERKGINSIVTQQTNIINNTLNDLQDSINSTDSNDESSKCGVICKLKSIVTFLKPSNLIHIIVPTQEQMTDLLDDTRDMVTSKMGILGLPIEVYTSVMNLVSSTNENSEYCFSWEDIPVPNYEEHNIINAGSYCFSSMLQKQSIANLRTFALTFTGALIILAFLQYLNNCKNRLLDVPDREDYIYFTQEDSYTIDDKTGEVLSHRINSRKTKREVAQ